MTDEAAAELDEQRALDELDELDGQAAEPEGGGWAVADLMAAAAAASDSGEPVVLESGRYKLFQDPGGAWVVARAVGTCDDCQHCGCGTQAQVITIPGFIIQLAFARANGGGGPGAMLRALRGRGVPVATEGATNDD